MHVMLPNNIGKNERLTFMKEMQVTSMTGKNNRRVVAAPFFLSLTYNFRNTRPRTPWQTPK